MINQRRIYPSLSYLTSTFHHTLYSLLYIRHCLQCICYLSISDTLLEENIYNWYLPGFKLTFFVNHSNTKTGAVWLSGSVLDDQPLIRQQTRFGSNGPSCVCVREGEQQLAHRLAPLQNFLTCSVTEYLS